MKRVPPIVGLAVLEEEDVEQMPPEAVVKLAYLYGGILGVVVGVIIGSVL